jgi:hypothetical protein
MCFMLLGQVCYFRKWPRTKDARTNLEDDLLYASKEWSFCKENKKDHQIMIGHYSDQSQSEYNKPCKGCSKILHGFIWPSDENTKPKHQRLQDLRAILDKEAFAKARAALTRATPEDDTEQQSLEDCDTLQGSEAVELTASLQKARIEKLSEILEVERAEKKMLQLELAQAKDKEDKESTKWRQDEATNKVRQQQLEEECQTLKIMLAEVQLEQRAAKRVKNA